MMKLQVNHHPYEIDCPPDMPLLWALRDLIGLTGTKFGCGMSLCGACTVHADNEAIRACMTPVSAVAGKQITTIEGIPDEHPVLKAWKELNVPQCGYCQCGQIMSAIRLLADNAKPNDDEINTAMAGNICRCGTYPRIKAAIKLASKEMAK